MKSKEQFEFKVSDEYENPAIWARLHGKEVMVFLMPLFESLNECYQKRRISPGIAARFQIFKDEVTGYYYDDSCGSYQTDYDRETYIASAIHALTALCNHILAGHKTPYTSFSGKTAEQMLIDLQHLVIPKSYSQIFYNEVQIEDFSFRFLEPYSCDTPYEIKIGDRAYISCLSDWSTTFNQIRNEIEVFVYTMWPDDTDINLYYEDSPTIIRVRMRNLFANKRGLRVAVIPDEFSRRPTLFGWCKARQLVRSLYLGLLELFTIETDWLKDEIEGDWNSFRLKSYNQLQSNAIEDYINGAEEKDEYISRNRVVHSVEEILEDYNILKTTLNQVSIE